MLWGACWGAEFQNKGSKMLRRQGEKIIPGRVFSYGGAAYEIRRVDTESAAVDCVRVDFGTGRGRETTWALGALQMCIASGTAQAGA